ncbi:MAG: GGDEF domain-containing protein, partial [Chromatocurvus sp.]
SIHDHLMTVEAQLLAFFHSMESERLGDAEANLEAMRVHFESLSQLSDDVTQPLGAVDYERILQIAYADIQRIRGYAYLFNVVMASEAYEMLYLAEATAERVLNNIDALQADIDSTRRLFAYGLGAAIIVIALLALLMLRSVTRSIAHPLRSVAEEFRNLARGGEDPIQLRSYHNDEIGDLVTAAEAFRTENIQVRQLLADYEALNASLEVTIAERTEELQLKNKELDRLASIDNLTGINNRRVLDATLARELALAARYDRAVGVVLLDIDLFKTINDTLGHLTGDKVLVRLAALIGDVIRNTDVFGRWGGEEFLVICPHATLADVRAVAEKIRAAVAEDRFIEGSPVTVSAGVSISAPKDSGEALISRADKALYQAKSSGRNCVITSPPPLSVSQSASS